MFPLIFVLAMILEKKMGGGLYYIDVLYDILGVETDWSGWSFTFVLLAFPCSFGKAAFVH